MSVGLVMLQYVTASTNVVQTVYYDTIAKEAANAGAVRALSCIKQNTMTWNNTTKLKPNTDCAGATLTGPTAPKWYLAHPSTGLSYSTFEVDAVELNEGGVQYTSTGKVVFGQDENHTTASGADTYSKSTSVDIPYTEISTIWPKAQGNVVRQISANAWNTCAVANELPYCWGGNAWGEGGNGAGAVNLIPTRVNSGALASNKKVSFVENGNLSGCAISDGRAVCWGRQLRGQLGNNVKTDGVVLPTAALGDVASRNITKMSMGDSTFFTCLITEGMGYCAGGNDYAQLGQIDYMLKGPLCDWPWGTPCGAITGIRNVPRYTSGGADADLGLFTPIFGFSNRPLENQSQMYGKRITDISSGSYGACATLNGQVFCWGDRFVSTNVMPWDVWKGNTAWSDGWKAITHAGDLGVGESTGCTAANSRSWCWGAQPGDGVNYLGGIAGIYTPNGAGSALENIAITGIDGQNDRGPQCVFGGGNAYCWGNFVGYIPSNPGICIPQGCQRSPGKVAIDNQYNVTSVAAGREHGCSLANGTVYCWGQNTYGELGTTAVATGTQSQTPVRTDNVIGTTSGYAATKLSAGKNHNCAIVNGRIFCWGANSTGQIGTNDTGDKPVPITPSGFVGHKGATDVSAGLNHSCGIVNGTAYCWGDNTYGQLGRGTASAVPATSAQPVNLPGQYFTAISAGTDHTCGISNSTVYCWGRNNTYQIGDNTTTQRNNPTALNIGSGSAATSISVGNGFSCAVVDGKAWCWGTNASGQIGRSSAPTIGGTQNTPVQVNVPATSVFTDIEAGDNFVCGIINGYANCWGDNTSGQLGRGTTGYTATQYQVVRVNAPVNGKNTTSLSVGDTHACSVSNHLAYCWGNNTNGKLGNNSTTASNIPVPVQADAAVFGTNYPYEVAAGGSSTCGLANGKIACWGAGNNGQIGVLGNITPKLVPTWTDDYKVGTFVLDYDAIQIY